jgi:hypothetical protein
MIAGPDLGRGLFQGSSVSRCAPVARIQRVCGESAALVRNLGKTPLPTHCPHTFSTGKSMRPVNFSVENPPDKNVTDFFSCTPRGLRRPSSHPVVTGVPVDCPQPNPPTAHKLATGSQQVIHRLVLALALRDARMSEPPVLGPPDVRPVWYNGFDAGVGRYAWGGGVW